MPNTKVTAAPKPIAVDTFFETAKKSTCPERWQIPCYQ